MRITNDLVVDDHEIKERFVRSMGADGQNPRRKATAVELRFDIASSALPAEVKARLLDLAGSRVTAEGVLIIDSREHRTQAQNREAARVRLMALLQHAARRPKPRKKTRPRAAAREHRLESKKRRGAIKELRGRKTSFED